jgi:hypothetical protein
MKRRKQLILAIVVLIVALLVAAGSVAARDNKEEISGEEWYGLLSYEEARVWHTEGGVVHIRGAKQVNKMKCDDPRVVGVNNVVVNGNLKLDGDVWAGPMWGTYQIVVDDIDGSWDGTWTGKVYPDGSMSIRAHADGSGALEGLKTFVTVERGGPYDAYGEFTGYILATHREK